jgi:uncharacterized OB-fold protein
VSAPRPYAKPLPKIEPDAARYWDSLKHHSMLVPRCRACGQSYFPPSDFCPQCLSDDTEWVAVSGSGSVYSSVTMHRAYTPAYEQDVPYNVSLVDLDEGVRMWTNVIGCPPSEVHCGMRVEIVYEDVTDNVTLARFQPIPRDGAKET